MRMHLVGMVVLIAGILLSGIPGCGSGPPSPADSDAAHVALNQALAAWKDGKPAESLKDDQPPIEIADHQWSNGLRLVKYEIAKNSQRFGAEQKFEVVLWLRDTKGKSKKEMTEYLVGTDPKLTVIRGY